MRRLPMLFAGLSLLATPALGLAALPATTVTAAPAQATEYTVKNGDTLIGIASKLGIKLNDLLTANNMTASSMIYPGQKLVVPAAPPAPPAPGPSYTIRNGDYLAGIASRSGVNLSDLLAVNGFTATSLIKPGQVITLPAGAAATGSPAAPAPAAGGSTYTVKSGDYLSGIAASHGVRLTDLLAVNSITVSSIIRPGQTLALPAGAKAKPAAAAPAQGGQSASSKVNTVVNFALAQQGKAYKFFTAGPATFDCSGLTLAAYSQIGIKLPHYSLYQAALGTPVDWNTQEIKPGDLVFTYRSSTPGQIGHVGIALSDSMWINAPQPGDVVKIAPMPSDAKIKAVRRFVN
jgi:LysM repeat protein